MYYLGDLQLGGYICRPWCRGAVEALARRGRRVTPQALKAWRGRLGLSQTAAAAALGLSRRAYQHYESGTRAIPEPAPGIAALAAEVESKAASEGRE